MFYTYKQVESALADLLDIDSEQRGALRGRIKHFQTLGITPSSPGKGKKISYEFDDVYKWALCLEFVQFGIDPTLISQFVIDYTWNEQIVDRTYPLISDFDLFYYFYPRLFAVGKKGILSSFGGFIAKDMSRLNEPGRPAHERYNERFRARYGAINVSKLHRDLEAALAKAVEGE
jgi:hypothetical protein